MTPQLSRTRRGGTLPARGLAPAGPIPQARLAVDLGAPSVRECAVREARRVAEMERIAWRAARDRCLQLEKIRRNARRRIAAMAHGSPEKFTGERALAEAALREVVRCEPYDSAAYTILSFSGRRDRLRYLRGSDADRDALVRATLARGGVRNDRGHFQEILR